MAVSRRGFLGILAAGASAAIIRTPGLLMPIKPALAVPTPVIIGVDLAAPGTVATAIMWIEHGNVCRMIDTTQPDVFIEMSRAILDTPLSGLQNARFKADSQALDRIDERMMIERRVVGGSYFPPTRMFRGLPIERIADRGPLFSPGAFDELAEFMSR